MNDILGTLAIMAIVVMATAMPLAGEEIITKVSGRFKVKEKEN